MNQLIIKLSDFTKKADSVCDIDSKYSSIWFRKTILLPILNDKPKYDKIIIDFSDMEVLKMYYIKDIFQKLILEDNFSDFNGIIIKCKEDEGLAADVMFYVQEVLDKIR